jgi:hypothetical protein
VPGDLGRGDRRQSDCARWEHLHVKWHTSRGQLHVGTGATLRAKGVDVDGNIQAEGARLVNVVVLDGDRSFVATSRLRREAPLASRASPSGRTCDSMRIAIWSAQPGMKLVAIYKPIRTPAGLPSETIRSPRACNALITTLHPLVATIPRGTKMASVSVYSIHPRHDHRSGRLGVTHTRQRSVHGPGSPMSGAVTWSISANRQEGLPRPVRNPDFSSALLRRAVPPFSAGWVDRCQERNGQCRAIL